MESEESRMIAWLTEQVQQTTDLEEKKRLITKLVGYGQQAIGGLASNLCLDGREEIRDYLLDAICRIRQNQKGST